MATCIEVSSPLNLTFASAVESFMGPASACTRSGFANVLLGQGRHTPEEALREAAVFVCTGTAKPHPAQK